MSGLFDTLRMSRICHDIIAEIETGTVSDPVNSPSHYTSGDIECIDAIRAALGRDGFIAFLRGQVIKYTWRLGLKDDAAQDAAKAHWYAEKLRLVLAEEGPLG